ncbi:MAG: type IV pilin, partial [Methanobacteriota archaeon]
MMRRFPAIGPWRGRGRVITRISLYSVFRNQSSFSPVGGFPMHRRKSWNVTGVSEVIGTILILAMTVVLFASIILWVSTFPTPAASVRLDMAGVEIPVYDSAGNWKGVNVTVDHKGGEALPGFRTLLFFQVNHLGTTKVVSLKTRGTELGVPYGINGPDTTWDTGETWYYSNNSVQAVDKITITVIDSVRSLILWNQLLQGAAGARPPLFLEKWADRLPQTPTIDILQTGQTFSVFTKVTDPDGDLRKNSVYVYFAFLYGTPGNRPPARMYDDGTNGDLVANDGTFSLAATWFKPTDLTWDGGVVIFNATDAQNHKSTSRMTLSVEPGPTQGSKPKGFGSGRPPNLNYNGLQGFNIFNGTEWDSNGFNATETRKFRESENVVVVVGSAILKDLFGKNTFLLYDPFSGAPLTPVVYGSNKQVTTSSIPSSTNAFDFFNYSNGYNIWIYRFDLNNVSTVGINFAKTPTRPPQYFFGAYPLDIDLIDFLGNRFATSDTITITANDGTVRNYPVLSTYRTSAYTQATTSFNSTDVVYVQIVMKTVDATANTVFLGNTVIQDFFGGYQVFKSPTSGPPQHANPPICPVTGTCTYNTGTVITINNAKIAYRYAVNLTLANQDPWVDGTQHYALRVLSMADSDESYSLVLSSQLLITAPLYRMDMVIGLDDASNPAWGSHDINFYFLNVNGVDKWIQNRIEPPYPKAVVRTTTIRMLDFNNDGRLDVVSSVVTGTPAPPPAGDYINLYRQDADQGGCILWTRSNLDFLDTRTVTDIRPALLNRDTAPEIVCAADDGQVWYYLNDGTWPTP